MDSVKIILDPHNTGVNLYLKKSIKLKKGVTILVGCNGCGKSTFIDIFKEYLRKKDIPFFTFDNLREGGGYAREKAGFYGDFSFLATSLGSSEGENIVLSMGQQAAKMGQFVSKHQDADDLFFFFDAIDSGLSIDNIEDIKSYLFKTVIENDSRTKDKNIYIIVSANEYEMCRNENCLDVRNGCYIKFESYDDYRNFIINSRKEKEKREDVKNKETADS